MVQNSLKSDASHIFLRVGRQIKVIAMDDPNDRFVDPAQPYLVKGTFKRKTEHIESAYDIGDGSWRAHLYKVHISQ